MSQYDGKGACNQLHVAKDEEDSEDEEDIEDEDASEDEDNVDDDEGIEDEDDGVEDGGAIGDEDTLSQVDGDKLHMLQDTGRYRDQIKMWAVKMGWRLKINADNGHVVMIIERETGEEASEGDEDIEDEEDSEEEDGTRGDEDEGQ